MPLGNSRCQGSLAPHTFPQLTAAHPEPVPKPGLWRDVLVKMKVLDGRRMADLVKRALKPKWGSDPLKEARLAPAVFPLHRIGPAEGRREQRCSFFQARQGQR